VASFGPNVADHDSLAVASQTVSQHVGELRGAVGNMVTFTVTKGKYYLLEESQRFVDKRCFFQDFSFAVSLLGTLTA